MKKNMEPTEHLEYIRDALHHAAQTNRTGHDIAFRNFLYNTLGTNIASRMAKERSNDHQVSGIAVLKINQKLNFVISVPGRLFTSP